jgi:hypothetical protein
MRNALIVALILLLTGCVSEEDKKEFRANLEKKLFWTPVSAPEPGYSCYLYGGIYVEGLAGVVCLKDESCDAVPR